MPYSMVQHIGEGSCMTYSRVRPGNNLLLGQPVRRQQNKLNLKGKLRSFKKKKRCNVTTLGLLFCLAQTHKFFVSARPDGPDQ